MYDVAYNYMFIHDLYIILGEFSIFSNNLVYKKNPIFLVGLIYFINI
jgi:hypothetical protein